MPLPLHVHNMRSQLTWRIKYGKIVKCFFCFVVSFCLFLILLGHNSLYLFVQFNQSKNEVLCVYTLESHHFHRINKQLRKKTSKQTPTLKMLFSTNQISYKNRHLNKQRSQRQKQSPKEPLQTKNIQTSFLQHDMTIPLLNFKPFKNALCVLAQRNGNKWQP